MCFLFFFCKQKTAYEMRISDWSSDVCSSDYLVRETRTSPVSENTAQKVALNYLKQKAISQTLKNQLAEIVKKNKDRVRYQSGYGPKVVEASRDIGSSGG